jgi:cysteine synthase A
MVAKSLGYGMLVVMPNDQAKEKMALVGLYGAELKLVDAVPFANPNHFYHTAQRIAQEDPEKYWWANQFHNLSNMKAHYSSTGPEIYRQLDGKVDVLVSAAGTGGTISGNSKFLKEKLGDKVRTVLVDPAGSGLANFHKTGEFIKADGSSITEGIGIMRLVPNFEQGKPYVDEAFILPDTHVVRIARHVRDQDGIPLGSSAALNVAGALRKAIAYRGQNKNIVTFWCDDGSRALSKLYNEDYLAQRGLSQDQIPSLQEIVEQYEREESVADDTSDKQQL